MIQRKDKKRTNNIDKRYFSINSVKTAVILHFLTQGIYKFFLADRFSDRIEMYRVTSTLHRNRIRIKTQYKTLKYYEM